jgi:transcriptional regulator with XRE-family HTH domain
MGRHYHLQKLGVRLKSMRKHRGLTQAQLAVLAGVTRHAVGAVEDGAESTAIGTYARVAAALGWELDVSPLTRPTLEELPLVFPSNIA